jgi:hypothetical protein
MILFVLLYTFSKVEVHGISMFKIYRGSVTYPIVADVAVKKAKRYRHVVGLLARQFRLNIRGRQIRNVLLG